MEATTPRYAVPVIMLHSVGADKARWPYAYLSEAVDTFTAKVEFLLRRGHTFIFHDDLFRYMRDGRPVPRKAVMLTFDDGFLDNWTIVFPLLKKLGVKFTVYVSQEFVDPSSDKRPTLEDAWSGRIQGGEVPVLGYLSWHEMRDMEKSGLVDIQSHTSTHSWHFTGNRIIDFMSPGSLDRYPWMAWNFRSDCKPYWPSESVRGEVEAQLLGWPVYENERAMVANRYLSPASLNTELSDHVERNGGSSFFCESSWRTTLESLVRTYRAGKNDGGSMEGREQKLDRLRYELIDNRTKIEKELNKEVKYLCWPGGAYNADLLNLVRECGYNASTVKEGWNSFGDDASKVNRISSGNQIGIEKFPWKYRLFTLRFYIARFQRRMWAVGLDSLYRRLGNG